MTSYAQNREDVILNRVFRDVKDGFYIDIGAYHPIIASVTNTFYDRGWSGVNVEPGSVFEELERARPRDVNLKAAVVDHDGEISFLESPQDPGTSQVLLEDQTDTVGKVQRIPAITLDSLVAKYAKGRTINFLKIDAEGSEAAIIRSTNWKNVRPQVLVIEATAAWSNRLVNQVWEPTLLANEYIRVFFDGINLYYLRSEDKALRSHFKIPVNVLDNYVVFDPAAAHARVENGQLVESLRQRSEENATLVERLAAANAKSDHLAASLDLSRSEVSRLIFRTAEVQRSANSLAARSGQYDNLITNLRDPSGPRALRLVLPLARIIRRISRVFGATHEVPSDARHASTPVGAVVSPSAPAPAPRPSLLKRIVFGVWRRYFKPHFWPNLERLRAYMTQPVREMVQANDEHVKSLEELLITIASQQRK